ncbi:unnamed protein product [Acanthoscelides obtectus]|uniref:Uncharacterized protein n=1 Tax=Acanthoscelides obtectus TaxID=200917 RepID=A0A9P0PES6_ACAOB|nr:unnamed protein product [Acanthoscelides obtectus]CAK1633677.1 hypothetical protein AOBTE_LOCUS8314 [Acanthoscelides obtectus]
MSKHSQNLQLYLLSKKRTTTLSPPLQTLQYHQAAITPLRILKTVSPVRLCARRWRLRTSITESSRLLLPIRSWPRSCRHRLTRRRRPRNWPHSHRKWRKVSDKYGTLEKRS